MWQIDITNVSGQSITVNRIEISNQTRRSFDQRESPLKITIPKFGVIRILEAVDHPSPAIKLISGSYVRYLPYDDKTEFFRLNINQNGTFRILPGDATDQPIRFPHINFLLGPFADEAHQQDYIERRFASLLNGQQDHEAAVSAIASANNSSFPDLDPVYNVQDPDSLLPLVRAGHLAAYPLTLGETVKSSTLCVLAGDKATPFLHVTTNLANMYLAVENAWVVNGRLEEREAAPMPEALGLAAVGVVAIPAIVLTLGKEVGTYIGTMIGSAAWQYVKTKFFGVPDAVPNYYDQVIASIEVMLKAEFQRQRCIEMKAKAKRFFENMDDYATSKSASDLSAAKSAATDLLSYADATALEGTFFYADASMMRIVVMQEEYFRAKPEDKQAHKELISRKAIEYASNVQNKYDNFLAHRISMISSEPYYSWKILPWTATGDLRTIGGVREGPHLLSGRNPDYSVVSNFSYPYVYPQIGSLRFDDSENGFWFTLFWDVAVELQLGRGTNWNFAEAQRRAYKAAIEKETKDAMDSLMDIKRKLMLLKDRPVPT